MMIVSFAFDVFPYKLCETLDTYLVRFCRFLAPVPGCFLAHESYAAEGLDYIILYEIYSVALFFPGIAVDFIEAIYIVLKPAFISQSSFKIRYMRICATESLHLIEGFEEYRHYRILVLLACAFPLGINIEQDHVCRSIRCKFHIRQHHAVCYLVIFYEIVYSMLAVHFTIIE